MKHRRIPAVVKRRIPGVPGLVRVRLSDGFISTDDIARAFGSGPNKVEEFLASPEGQAVLAQVSKETGKPVGTLVQRCQPERPEERPALTMVPRTPYNLDSDAPDWNGCLKAFLDTRPDLRARVRWTQHEDGEHCWAPAAELYDFYEWARQQGYLSAELAQFLMTCTRQAEDAQHNEQ